jgi:hypothetical protein
MSHLILQTGDTTWPGFSLLGEPSLAITMDETSAGFLNLPFLVLSGTTSVSIASTGVGGSVFHQLEETTNNLTKVTISGSVFLALGQEAGVGTGHSNFDDSVVTDIAATAKSPTTIHSSLTLIDASAMTGRVIIDAGATNTSSSGLFQNAESLNANVTITYTGLVIKGGSGEESFIENDAKNGIVTLGNGFSDGVELAGAGAKATLGTGTGDRVAVGLSSLGTNDQPGFTLGDTVKFGAAATNQVLISSHRKLLSSKAMVVSVAETAGHDPVRQG